MEKNVFTLLHDKHPVGEAVVRAYGMDLVPASRQLEKADSIFKEFAKRENLISRALKPVRDQYDYILFDCQPHLGLLTINALVASDYYIIPLQAECFALEGLSEMMSSVAASKEENEIDIRFGRVFLTRCIASKKLCKQVADTVQENLKEKVFSTCIHENIKVSGAQAHGVPIFQYIVGNDLQRVAAEDDLKLTEEILQKLNQCFKAYLQQRIHSNVFIATYS
jgi:chromosome partitioning protein